MDDFLLELRALDETQDRVEAVSDEMLRAHAEGDAARVNAMVTHWIDALRASDLHSERVAFLYVANHVLQKSLFGDADAVDSSGSATRPDFVGLFGAHMEEAVSLVSNSPMDRQNVTRLLELWHEKDVYPDEVILRMWRCTGEDLPSFLVSVAADSSTNGNGTNGNHEHNEQDDADHELRHTHLPMKLNAHSANPVLDVLKRIDYHKAVLQYLDRTIQEKHQFVLLHATSTYQSPEDVLADRTTTAAQLKRRAADCLRLAKIRNKYMTEIPALKKQLVQAVAKMKQDEIDAGSKIEQKLELPFFPTQQCDIIDIGLADLSEHRDTYPDEWSREAYECSLRRRRKEEEVRQREEQMVRLHQEAIAESAAHALHLEADINAGSSADLQTLSKELESQKAAGKEPKPEETNEMVWHPYLRRDREYFEHECDDACAEHAGGWERRGTRYVVERDAAVEHRRQRQLHRSTKRSVGGGAVFIVQRAWMLLAARRIFSRMPSEASFAALSFFRQRSNLRYQDEMRSCDEEISPRRQSRRVPLRVVDGGSGLRARFTGELLLLDIARTQIHVDYLEFMFPHHTIIEWVFYWDRSRERVAQMDCERANSHSFALAALALPKEKQETAGREASMSFFFQKPENALKRAKELIAIPGMDAGAIKRAKRSALEILHDALIAKKNRTWQPAHEELMIAYLDICIELQLGRIGKDGLHQYRNLSIQHNPASLETVITHFVSQTEQKLALAKRESNDLILLAAAKVDLEAAQTPEAVMLSTTTFEGSSDRTDREVVVPWLRFTWETYRTVLDILKNNTKLEGLYKSIALKAFDFCTEYTRKIEFRRLCEILRNHLGSLQKHTAAPTSQSSRLLRSWEGFTLEGVESLLEIRYRQLQVATDLELFSEAFRTIDDINTIMSLVDQVPRLELMVTYYEKLAQIFLVSKNHLFHAFALYKWYGLRIAGLEGINGGAVLATLPTLVSSEEQQEIATRVVLAALSIPLLEFESASPVLDDDSTPSAVNSAENSLSVAAREKNVRMASLLGFTSTPTRAILLEEIEAAGVIKKAVPEVSSLYHHLEREEVDPLQIVKLVQPHLAKIRELSNSYKNQTQEVSYANSVERLLVRRVLFQLTRVYSSVTIAHLRSLFVGLNVSYQEIEQLIVRSRSLSTVAHSSAPSLSAMYLKNQSNSNNSSSSSNNVEASTLSATASAMRTKIRIDHVQQIIRFSEAVELEANPAQLTLLGERLERVLKKVQYTNAEEAVAASRKHLFQTARSNLDATRSDMLERREIIERKKEELERLQQEKAKTIEKKRQEYEQMRQQVERERLEQEARRREAEKKQKIKDEIALKETKQMLDKLGHKDLESFDLENLDREKLMNDAKEKAQRAKEDAQKKLRDSARRLDYIIRATREVEQPILQKQFISAKEEAKQIYEQDKQEKLNAAKEAYEFGLKEKARLATVFTVHSEFVEAHYARRRELYKKAAEEHKKKALLERLEKRVAHAKECYDEEQERLREEEEERERLRREEEEEIERQRQEEIEEELRRQEEEEEENRRLAEEEKERELAAQREEEKEREASRSAYRPPVARRSEREEGEWTQVSRPSTARSAAPEGQWDRRGPPARDDRDAPRGSFRSGGAREGGLSRFGDREREPREGGFSRFGDREPREGGSSRFGDREREPREGGFSRFGDREREPREGGFSRFGDRDREPREGGLRRGFGGDREERPAREDGSSSGWRRGGGDREAAPRGEGDDRFFGSRGGDSSYRPPRGDGDKRPARETTRAPDSGRWR